MSELTLSKMNYCEVGKRIVEMQKNENISVNGNCTPLYFHLLSCDDCYDNVSDFPKLEVINFR